MVSFCFAFLLYILVRLGVNGDAPLEHIEDHVAQVLSTLTSTGAIQPPSLIPIIHRMIGRIILRGR